MKITIYAIGKLKEKHWQTAAHEYEQRLRRYTSYNVVEIKDTKPSGKSTSQIQADESFRLLQRISPASFVVALDKSGKSINSETLANLLHEKSLYGPGELAFCLGGPHGFSGNFLQKTAQTLSLSKLTFPHELARVILLEQLYRAFTILNGEKYHK